MAVRFSAAGGGYSRTSNNPTVTAFTVMGWFYIAVDRDAFSTFINMSAVGGADLQMLTSPDGVTLRLFNGNTNANGTVLVVGEWNHLTMRVEGTGANQFKAYLNGILDIDHTGNPSATNGELFLANNAEGPEWLNGRVAGVKVWDAILTPAEILQEKQQLLPIRTANLNTFSPFFSTDDDQVDFSGNGFDWTVNGSPTTEEAPPVPWCCGLIPSVVPAVVVVAAIPAARPAWNYRHHA